MPIDFERCLGAVPAEVFQFARSDMNSREPTHYEHDASLEETLNQCTERSKEISHREKKTANYKHYYKHYHASMKSADKLLQLLRNPDSARSGEVSQQFALFQDTCAIAPWRAVEAHMKNEESAKLATMIPRIAKSYEDSLPVFENARYVFLFFVAALLCQRLSLFRYYNSSPIVVGQNMSIAEYWQIRHVNTFLKDQLRRSAICYIFMRALCAQTLDLLKFWRRRHIRERRLWDQRFDLAVTLRCYANELAGRFEEVEMALVPMTLLVELGRMAAGWERTRIDV